MYWMSLAYFFVVSILFGTLIDLFVKDWKADWLEKLVMRFGVGLAALSITAVVLNNLHIPLDYRVFLAVGFLIFTGAYFKNKNLADIRLDRDYMALAKTFWKSKKLWYSIIVLVLFAVTANMYISGTFAYPYFEDGDPWEYASVSKYIADEKTYTAPFFFSHYSEPYTQGYQIVMGLMHQTNDSMYWNMKFFNALIISFGVLFAYYFARRFTKSEDAALLTAFFLFAIPAWVSHFIFSLNYNMTIFLVVLYVLAMLAEGGEQKEKKKQKDLLTKITKTYKSLDSWHYVGIIVFASLLINHFSTAVMGTLFIIIYAIVKLLYDAKIDTRLLKTLYWGFILALLYYIPSYARHADLITMDKPAGLGGFEHMFYPILVPLGMTMSIILLILVLAVLWLLYHYRDAWFPKIAKLWKEPKRKTIIWYGAHALFLVILLLPIELVKVIGSGTRDYHLKDFFVVGPNNMINNPIGIGIIVMTLVVLGVGLGLFNLNKLMRKSLWGVTALTWAIISFLLVISTYFSITLMPFRVWTFFGFFATLIAAWAVVSVVKGLTRNQWIHFAAFAIIALLVIPTTFSAKLQFNTTPGWPDQEIVVPESQQLYQWMRDGGIPKWSNVVRLCSHSYIMTGYDMLTPIADGEINPPRVYKRYYFDRYPVNTSAETMVMLKGLGIEYVTVGASCVTRQPGDQQQAYGIMLQERVNALVNDSRFTLVRSTGTELLFKI